MNQENSNQGPIDVDIKVEDTDSSAAKDEPAPEEVSTFRLVATLAIAGALAGLLIVMVNLHTKPIIDKWKAEQLQLAVYEVLPGVESYDTFYLVNDELSAVLPSGAKESEYKRVYVGRDENGETTGVAISRGESGFQDVIMVIFGHDPVSGKVSGMKILDSKETPGLGDKIFKDMDFVDQFFAGPDTPLLGVKAGAGKGQSNEIDMITGATISSKAVIQIINNAMAEWKPVLDRGIPKAPAVKAPVEEAP